MKPSLTDHDYGNNGLLDQLAALQWIKDNIEDLNGDPHSVTIMGHGTGAACVNFLMLSPISNGMLGLLMHMECELLYPLVMGDSHAIKVSFIFTAPMVSSSSSSSSARSRPLLNIGPNSATTLCPRQFSRCKTRNPNFDIIKSLVVVLKLFWMESLLRLSYLGFSVEILAYELAYLVTA